MFAIEVTLIEPPLPELFDFSRIIGQ